MTTPHIDETPRREHPAPLTDTRVMVVLRGNDEHRLATVAHTLVESGLTCIEVTFTVPRAASLLRELTQALGPTAAVGAGTVTNTEQAHAALDAGARFLVSPGLCPGVTSAATEHGVPHYPGAFTPTEVLQAWQAGAAAVKLFPASLLGPTAIGSLRGPFPTIPLIPTGGITPDTASTWIDAGALAVGVGNPLLGDAPSGGDLGALRSRAQRLLATVSTTDTRTPPEPPAKP